MGSAAIGSDNGSDYGQHLPALAGSLLCPTDFSADSEQAFLYALAIALHQRRTVAQPVKLTLLHAATAEPQDDGYRKP